MKLSPLSALLCNERAKLVIAKARIPVIARTICVLFRLFCWQHDWHTSSLSSLECFVVLFWDYSNILLVWCYSVFSWILIWCVLTWYLFWCTVNLCYHAGLEKLRGQIATQIFLLFFDSQCVEDIFATKGTVIYCLAPVCPCIYPFFLLYCIQGHFKYRGIVLNYTLCIGLLSMQWIV